MTKVKPCPFCGKDAIATKNYNESNGADDIVVGCPDPLCFGRAIYDFAGCDEAKQFFNELIELWNKRSEILNVQGSDKNG